MLKQIVAMALGAGLALSPLAALAQTDQSTTAPAAAAPAPQKTGRHAPHRRMRERRMHMQRTGHMPPHPAAAAPAAPAQ
jgi:hypothetical protein